MLPLCQRHLLCQLRSEAPVTAVVSDQELLKLVEIFTPGLLVKKLEGRRGAGIGLLGILDRILWKR